MVCASVNLRAHAGEALPRHARADAGAAGGARGDGAADDPPPLGRLPRTFTRVIDRLQAVYRTENDVLLFTSAGTAAMESAVANVCSPATACSSSRTGTSASAGRRSPSGYGLDVDHLRYEWGELPSPDEVGARLEEIGGAKVVYLTHSDTSTAASPTCRRPPSGSPAPGALIAVDAISSLAAVPLETDDWGLDIVLTSSHKALMCPAGLAFAAISPAALEATQTASLPRYYMDWQRAIAAQAMGETPFSTAISLVRGLDVALDLILADGLAAAHERHLRLGRAARAGVKAMGLELFSPDADSSAVVTAIRMPEEIDGQAIVASMRERSGVTIIGGQGEQRGKIVRFGTSATWTCRTSPPRSPRSSARSWRPAPTSSAGRPSRRARGARRARRGVRSGSRPGADRGGGDRPSARAIRRRRRARRRPGRDDRRLRRDHHPQRHRS